MSEFVEYLNEMFEHFGPINARRMFGGHGVLHHNDLMIALVADDVLHLKADSDSSIHFDKLKFSPFEFDKNGKKVTMSYFPAPEAIYDNPNEARIWANRAHEAALRSKRQVNKKKVHET